VCVCDNVKLSFSNIIASIGSTRTSKYFEESSEKRFISSSCKQKTIEMFFFLEKKLLFVALVIVALWFVDIQTDFAVNQRYSVCN
jgi:hypothetical protein